MLVFDTFEYEMGENGNILIPFCNQCDCSKEYYIFGNTYASAEGTIRYLIK